MLVILLMINPYVFGLSTNKGVDILVISVFFLTVFFPIFATFMMKFLGLIKSIKMEEKSDRIAPLVTTGVFYMWLFINVKDNPGIPPSFSFFVLGATIAVFIGLIFNNFIKVSLHTMAVAGMLASLILIKYFYSYSTFVVETFDADYIISTNLVLLVVILIAGLVGTSRLLLGDHTSREVFLGYAIGIISQIIAFRFFIM